MHSMAVTSASTLTHRCPSAYDAGPRIRRSRSAPLSTQPAFNESQRAKLGATAPQNWLRGARIRPTARPDSLPAATRHTPLITRARPMSTNLQIPSPPSISCACNADALQVGVGMSCSLRSYIRSTACFTSTSIRPLNRHARWHGEDRGNWRESWCRLGGNIKRILHDLHSSCGLTGIRYVRARSPPESRHRRVLLD